MPRWSRALRRCAAPVALVTVAATLAACGDSSDDGSTSASTSGSGEKVTINFVNPEVKGAFDPLIRAFERTHPNISVKAINVPFDQLSSTLQARLGARDDSIDAYVVDPPAIPNLVQRGFVEDLSELTPDSEAASIRSSVDSAVYEGKQWAVPIWTSEQFLYYNRDLLRRAGVPYPPVDPADRWTWEQTVAAAQRAKDAGAQWGILFDQTDRYYQLQALAESAGGGSGLRGDDNLEPDLTNPGWVKAMTWYQDLFKDGLAPKGVATDQMNPLFAAGKAAFFVGGPWALAQFNADRRLHFGVAPHPYFEGGRAVTPTDSWSWGVNPAAKHRDAAVEFVKFASTTREGNLATIARIFIPPTNREAFAEYTKQLDASGGDSTRGAGRLMLTELEETATHRPASPGYLQFETLMNGKVLPDIRNGANVEDRLAQANDELTSAFSRLKR